MTYDNSERIILCVKAFSNVAIMTLGETKYYRIFDGIKEEKILLAYDKENAREVIRKNKFLKVRGYLTIEHFKQSKSYLYLDSLSGKREKYFREKYPELLI